MQGTYLHPCLPEPAGTGFPPAQAVIRVIGEGPGLVRGLRIDRTRRKIFRLWFFGTASCEIFLHTSQACFLSETLRDALSLLRGWLSSTAASPARPLVPPELLLETQPGPPFPSAKRNVFLQLGEIFIQVPVQFVMERAAAGKRALRRSWVLRDPSLGAAATSPSVRVGTGALGLSGSLTGTGSPRCLFSCLRLHA